jgi:hypothetical protein
MEWYQTPGSRVFDVFDTVPFIPFQPLLWAGPPHFQPIVALCHVVFIIDYCTATQAFSCTFCTC